MVQPTEHEWNSLANLIVSGNDYLLLMGLLQRNLEEQDIRNRSMEGIDLHRGQGRAQLLQELLQAMNDAPEVRRQLRERS